MATASEETRQSWQDAADSLVTSALREVSPAGLRLPGRPSKHGRRIDALESLARTLETAAYAWKGLGSDRQQHWATQFAGALEETFGRGVAPDAYGQPVVEAASFAIAIGVMGDDLLPYLSDTAVGSIVEWLDRCSQAVVFANNWRLFPWLAACAVQRLVGSSDHLAVTEDRALTSLLAWSPGRGWIHDGPTATYDWYGSWAMHHLPAVASSVFGRAIPDELVKSAVEHARSVMDWFDQGGGPILVGRSLTYGAGAAALLGSCHLHPAARVTSDEAAMMRSVAGRAWRHHLDGSLTTSGLLRLGRCGSVDVQVDTYSGPGAPYWAGRVFAPLLLEPRHPFWVTPDQPARNGASSIHRFESPVSLVTSKSSAGPRLTNHGSTARSVASGRSAFDGCYSSLHFSTRWAPRSQMVAEGPSVRLFRKDWGRGLISASWRGDRHMGSESDARPLLPPRKVGAVAGRLVRRLGLIPRIRVVSLFHGPWIVDVVSVRGFGRLSYHGPISSRMVRLDASSVSVDEGDTRLVTSALTPARSRLLTSAHSQQGVLSTVRRQRSPLVVASAIYETTQSVSPQPKLTGARRRRVDISYGDAETATVVFTRRGLPSTTWTDSGF